MIELLNVSVSFEGQHVLDKISFEMKRNEFVYLVGQTGAGKSSLMRLLYMDLKPNNGRVKVAGYDSKTITNKQVPLLRRRLGVIFQDFRLLDDRNVYENVAFALYVTNARRTDIKKKVLHALSDVGLSHKRNQMPNELSGGEQQRVVIARAIVNEPVMILADEPTGNLDIRTGEQVLVLLTNRCRESGTTLIMATHSPLTCRYSDRILRMIDGIVVEESAGEMPS